MELKTILVSLKEDFGLKDNHILILETLHKKESTADEICAKTKIPKGRIYEFLNDLLQWGLIEKQRGFPARYSAKGLEGNIHSFLNLRVEELIKREVGLLDKLGQKEADEIKFVTSGTLAFYSEMIKLVSEESRYIGAVTWPNSVPLILYPREPAAFHKIRSEATQKRKVLINFEEQQQLFFINALLNASRKRPVRYLANREAIETFYGRIKSAFGKKELEARKKDILNILDTTNFEVRVWDFQLTQNMWVTDNRFFLVFGVGGASGGLVIKSPKIARSASQIFEDAFSKGEDIRKVLGKIR